MAGRQVETCRGENIKQKAIFLIRFTRNIWLIWFDRALRNDDTFKRNKCWQIKNVKEFLELYMKFICSHDEGKHLVEIC